MNYFLACGNTLAYIRNHHKLHRKYIFNFGIILHFYVMTIYMIADLLRCGPWGTTLYDNKNILTNRCQTLYHINANVRDPFCVSLVNYLIPGSENFHSAIVGLVIVAKFASNSGWVATVVWTLESYPTVIRYVFNGFFIVYRSIRSSTYRSIKD